MFNPINYLMTRIRSRRLFKDPGDIKKRVAVLNFSYGNFNFGAILLSYASQSVLGKLGYTPYILNFNPEFKNYWRLSRIRGNIAGINFSFFRYKYLNTTRIYYNYKSLLKSNDDFSTFIFGSDQIWRYAITKGDYGIYFGNFARGDKRLVAYAASFGKDKWDEAPQHVTADVKNLLKPFKGVSMREDSGVKICKDVFGVEAEHVLDPTLLLDAADYEPIYRQSRVVLPRKYAAVMLFDDTQLSREVIEALRRACGVEFICITAKSIKIFGRSRTFYRPVADWLCLLKNAEFVLTNSFHCCAFSILFRRQFVCLGTSTRGNSRLESLFKQLGTGDRIADSAERARALMEKKIDYDAVFSLLGELRGKSLEVLKHALSCK